MNILLVYLKTPYSPQFYLERVFKRKYNIESFDFAKTPYWSDLRFILPFYIPKGFPVSAETALRKSFFNSFSSSSINGKKTERKVDLILEITSSGQYHLTGYKKLKKQISEIKTILWALDVYRADQRKFMLWMKNDFDYIFTTQKNFVDVFYSQSYPDFNISFSIKKQRKNIKAYWLTYAAEPEIHRKFDLPKIYDVVFVGNINPKVYPERVKLLKLIGKKFNLKVFSGIYGLDMAKIYSQSKIVFNKSCAGEINMRIFETLSCGSLLITDKLNKETGLEELFQNNKHLVLYDSENDLLEKINYYLIHNSEREEIANSGYKEVLAKHTYEHRAKEMLKTIFTE